MQKRKQLLISIVYSGRDVCVCGGGGGRLKGVKQERISVCHAVLVPCLGVHSFVGINVP